jgi:hypothetical protein
MIAPYTPFAKAQPCFHCKRPTLNAGRGLCLRCYRTPAIRQLYPARKPGRPKQPHGYCAGCQSDNRPLVGLGLCWHCAQTEVEDQLLAQTDAHRQQRIARYAERAARRLPLFHD